MSTSARSQELIEAARKAKSVSTPEQARDCLRVMANLLPATDKAKCIRYSQELGDNRVMETCKQIATSLLTKLGAESKPWWKFW